MATFFQNITQNIKINGFFKFFLIQLFIFHELLNYCWMRTVAHCMHALLLLSEVKQCRARSVLGWETAWEHWVLTGAF